MAIKEELVIARRSAHSSRDQRVTGTALRRLITQRSLVQIQPFPATLARVGRGTESRVSIPPLSRKVISFGLDRAKNLATGSPSKTPESFYLGLWRPRWAKTNDLARSGGC